MLINDPAVWRLANLLINRHKSDVKEVVRAKADRALKRNDMGEYLVWQDILQAVAILSAPRISTQAH
jgi:hypothetical protein